VSADTTWITYRFHLPAGVEELTLEFDTPTFTLRPRAEVAAPAWARLGFHQCPHCPLTADQSPLCPFAQGLAGFVERFDAFRSFDKATIEIVTEVRTVVATKPLQQGMASLVGLIGATSGCPHLAFYRPMARFHLPFARDDETLYRVFSMYLLGRYLADDATASGPRAMDGLIALTSAAIDVNRGMAERVRAALTKDVVVNAVVILDMFAQAVPYVIEDGLDELRVMFGLGGTDDAAAKMG
jgi:hypothetical protein